MVSSSIASACPAELGRRESTATPNPTSPALSLRSPSEATVKRTQCNTGSERRELAPRPRRGSRAQEKRFVEERERKELTRMGRYPFVCAYRRYLKGVRARLSQGTIV